MYFYQFAKKLNTVFGTDCKNFQKGFVKDLEIAWESESENYP